MIQPIYADDITNLTDNDEMFELIEMQISILLEEEKLNMNHTKITSIDHSAQEQQITMVCP